MSDQRSPELPDAYDAKREKLDGLPDVVRTKPSTIRVTTPYGRSETYILESFRQAKVGDWIFLEVATGAGNLRLVIPPEISKAIARQRDALTAKGRSKAAKAEAQRRKDEGIAPGFLRKVQP